MKLLAFGEVLWDIYPDAAHIGGAPLNFAAHALRWGLDARMLSAVGRDELGDRTLQRLEEMGISTVHITRNGRETGACRVTLNGEGVPSYRLLEGVAYDEISLSRIGAEDFDALYFGTLALRGEHNRRILTQLLDTRPFREVLVDLNLRPPFYDRECVELALSRATLLKVSEEELPAAMAVLDLAYAHMEGAGEELARHWPGLKLILITRGAQGAAVLDCTAKQWSHCPGERVEALSTVGAGDSFAAAFLARYAGGDSLGACLAAGVRVSAFVVSRQEAVPDYDPEALMKKEKSRG